jgi:hypothetical protein
VADRGDFRGYNGLKLEVLRALRCAPHGWLTPREIAQRVRFSRIRSAWSYLLRLYRWGLLRRRSAPYIEYSLTRKGFRRLAWLQLISQTHQAPTDPEHP